MKPHRKHILLLMPLIVAGTFIFAQQPQLSLKEREQLISKIENLAERTEAELDYSDLVEGLYVLLEQPLSLNNAGYDELSRLFFLSEFQIQKLIGYRNSYGDLLSIYELLAVEGFDRETIELMRPFVNLEPKEETRRFSIADALKYGRHDLFLRYGRIIEQQAGYAGLSDSAKQKNPNSYYLGSPGSVYLRYGYRFFDKLRLGLTADKDAGEEFFTGSQPNGFDFYSGFAWIADLGVIKELVIGDYHVEFGQGLTLWSGLAFGKSSDAVSVVRSRQGIRPNTSANENLFMRGSAATAAIGNFCFTGFYSSKMIDANVGERDTVDQEILFVTSLQQTGYHRTYAELVDKHAIREQVFGGHAEYRKNRMKIGATAYKTVFGSTIQENEQLYQKFYFSGTQNLNYGVDLNYLAGRFNFFGEASGSANGGRAFVVGTQAILHPRVSLAMLYRDYGLKYQNLFSNAFGEGSRNQGERGIYSGIRLELHRYWSFYGYADFFAFPWIRYRVDQPSSGHEYMGQLSFFPSRDLEIYFRHRSEVKAQNFASENAMPVVKEICRRSFRLNAAMAVSPSMVLKNRVEINSYRQGGGEASTGFLIYQDVLFRPENSPWDLSLRYALFDTETYDARIYAYENDVLYAFSIPAYYYQGSRFYVLLKYEATAFLDAWIRFAQTFYSNQKTIGSGLSEIHAKTKSEIKIQIRVKF
ncbi:MAG: helix-hairpin-helix domain-containing protein [Bacteroidales bacterium]